GRRSENDFAPVHTFKYRQSSLVGGAGAPPRPPPGAPCRHRGLNSSALRMPSHFATGCGGLQRRAPVGGAAKGMPLKAAIPELVPDVPVIKPESVLTGFVLSACARALVRIRKPMIETIANRFIELAPVESLRFEAA